MADFGIFNDLVPGGSAAAAVPPSSGEPADFGIFNDLVPKPRGGLAEAATAYKRGVLTGIGNTIAAPAELAGEPDSSVGAAGQSVRDYGASFAPSPGREGSFLTNQLPEALGGVTAAAPAAVGGFLVGGPPGALAGGMLGFGMQGAGAGGEAARQQGATPGEQQGAAAIGGTVNALLAAIPGGTVSKLLRLPAQEMAGVLGYAFRTAQASGEAATVGGLGQAVENAYAQYTFDPKRTLSEGVGQAAKVTGALGGLLHGTIGEFTRSRQQQAPPPPDGADGERAPLALPAPATPMGEGAPAAPTLSNEPLALPAPRPIDAVTAAALARQADQETATPKGRANFAQTSGLLGDPRAPNWPAENLVTITAPSGAPFTVHRLAAPAFEGFLRDLESAGYDIDPTKSGGYAFRNKTGGSTLSEHAYGNAIDINWNKNLYSRDGKLTTDLPQNVADIAARWGLSWGGDWHSVKDAMHFEWTGEGLGAADRMAGPLALPAPEPRLALPKPDTTYGDNFTMRETPPEEPQKLLPKPATIYGDGFTAGAPQTGSALDRALYAVSQLNPGDPVTRRLLAEISGLKSADQVATLRDRLVNRGLVNLQNGRYTRAETANGPEIFAPQPATAAPPSPPPAIPAAGQPNPVAAPMRDPTPAAAPQPQAVTPTPELSPLLRQPEQGIPAMPAPPAVAGPQPSAAPNFPAPQPASRAPDFARVVKPDQMAVTATGRLMPVDYAIADAEHLVASHNSDLAPNPEFPSELQPRDRSRVATELQIHNMLNPARFRPELLGETPDASTGAPVVGPDRVIESGNARTLALRRAYNEGLPAADAYRSFLEQHGYPVAGIDKPLLVRLNRTEWQGPADREAATREMNAPMLAAMSSTERAMTDARALPNSVLELHREGELTSAGNRQFMRRTLESVSTPAELGALVDQHGEISTEGVRRVQGALLAKAYGSPEILARLVESADNNIRTIGHALVDAAPAWARLRAEIAAGRVPGELDITPHLVEAVGLIARARDEGRNVAEFTRQSDIFGGGLSPETELVLQWMLGGKDFTRRVGQAKITEAARWYAEEAMKAQPGPDLLGDQPQRRAGPMIERARVRAQDEGGNLFGAALGEPAGAEPVRPGAAARGAADRRPQPGESGTGNGQGGAAPPIADKDALAREILAQQRRYDLQRREAADNPDQYDAAVRQHGAAMERIAARHGLEYTVDSPLAEVTGSEAWRAARAAPNTPHAQFAAARPLLDRLDERQHRPGLGWMEQVRHAAPSPVDQVGLRDELYRILHEKAPTLRLKTFESLSGYPMGLYDTKLRGDVLEHIATVALSGPEAAGVLHHEIVHFFRGAGLFTRQEWAALARKAEQWRRDYDIDSRYADRSEGVRNEEAVAEAYAAWSRGELQLPPGYRRIFGKAKEVFERIGNFLRGNGLQSVEDVFRRADEGEIGRRPASDVPTPGEAMEARPNSTATPEERAALDRIMQGRDERPLAERLRALPDRIGGNLLARWKQGYLDRWTGVGETEKAAKRAGASIGAANSPVEAFRTFDNLPGIVHSILGVRSARGWLGGALRYNAKDGTFETDPGSKPFAQIFEPVFSKGLGDQWALWAIVNRARRLAAEGREHNVSAEDITRFKDLDRKYLGPNGENVFRDTLRQWSDLNRRMLDLAQDRGLIDPELRKLWAAHDYVPFFRVIDDGTIQGPQQGGGTLTGRALKVGDIYDNMTRNLASLTQRSLKNEALRRTVEIAEPLGFVSRIDKSTAPVSDALLEQRLKAGGIDPASLSPAQREGYRNLVEAASWNDPNVLSLMRGGKIERYRIDNPLLLRSIASMGPRATDGVLNAFRIARLGMTHAVMLDPAFMAAHFLRMSLHGWATTGYDITPGLSAAKGAVSAFRNSPSAMALMAGGGGGAGGEFKYGLLPHEIRSMMQEPSFARTVLDGPKKLLDFGERLGRASDMAVRIAAYEDALSKGLGKAEAIARARDVLNFSNRGDYQAMRFLIDTVPFLNARLQGLSRTWRGAKENPQSLMMRGAMIAAATTALWAANKDDSRYRALEDWDKEYAWHFFIGDQHFRLPKPFEVGALFATLPEMLLDYADNGRAKQLRNAFASDMLNQLRLNPVPMAIRPLGDLYANRDSFTGHPIVTAGEERLAPELRYGPGASPTMVALGRQLGVSPAQAEFLVRAYGAQMGTYLLAATDALAESAGLVPAQPERRLDQMPVISRFLKQEPAQTSRWLTEFYALKGEVDQVMATAAHYREQGNAAGLQELAADHATEFGLHGAVGNLAQQFAALRRQSALIQANETMSPADKRARLDQLTETRNRLAATAAPPLLRHAEGLPTSP